LEVVQRTHQMPLGGTRFAQTLAWHLQRVDPALVKGSSVSSNDGGTRR
jgi:hypothetical protein